MISPNKPAVISFTANVVLFFQSGYFSGAADLKPLLHVWSLSIEEQYYLLLPAFLAFVPRKHWVSGSLLLLLGSLVACFALLTIKPVATFYLLPTRAWELGISRWRQYRPLKRDVLSRCSCGSLARRRRLVRHSAISDWLAASRIGRSARAWPRLLSFCVSTLDLTHPPLPCAGQGG